MKFRAIPIAIVLAGITGEAAAGNGNTMPPATVLGHGHRPMHPARRYGRIGL